MFYVAAQIFDLLVERVWVKWLTVCIVQNFVITGNRDHVEVTRIDDKCN